MRDLHARFDKRGIVVLLALMALSACARPLLPAPVEASRVTSFQRGVGLGLFASEPDFDYGALLDEIVAHGATDVLIAVVWYQRDVKSHDIARRDGFSPSDATVLRTLKQAKARGLRVSLLPIVRLVERRPDEWRGRIQPEAGVDIWFERYGAFLLRMARLAEAAQVERFSVGSELLSLERYEAEWRKLIDRVRARYSGKLFYSANWDHFEPIRFWDALDEVGVTAYFELTHEDGRPSREDLLEAWLSPRRELHRFARKLDKPLVITEIGYPAKATAARYPWDETRQATIDLALQATLYDVFCESFQGASILAGAYFWNWFGHGGPSDSEYTPRNKPAAQVMKRCLTSPRWDESLRREETAP